MKIEPGGQFALFAAPKKKRAYCLSTGARLLSVLADVIPSTETRNQMAYSVHFSIAEAAVTMIACGVSRCDVLHAALSGGVFMNRILNDLVTSRLQVLGMRALIHRRVPPNDGCIAFGQAVVAENIGV